MNIVDVTDCTTYSIVYIKKESLEMNPCVDYAVGRKNQPPKWSLKALHW